MQVLKQDIQKQFLKNGYMKTSMRQIAQEVGVGVGNLYNYYPNKDILFQAIVSPATSLLERMVQEDKRSAPESENRCISFKERISQEVLSFLFERFGVLFTI